MASTLKETFGERVKARRLALKLTQTELAERAEMRQSTISDVESGEHAATIDTVERLARALRCKPSALIP